MTPGTSTLLLSDFHAGHNASYGERKIRAIEAMMECARRTRVGEFVLAGDIADERPDRESVRAECAVLRDALAGYDSVFLHGNHDDAAFFDASDLSEMLRCRVDARPWHVSPISGVTVTHGHHFRMPSVRRALRDASHIDDVHAVCERKKRQHEAMNKGFSFAGKFGDSLESAGIPATGMWEGLQQVTQRSRSKMAVALRRPKRLRGIRRIAERFADMIDLRSVRHAARLARAMGTWGVVSGHTHVPGLYKYFLRDEGTGERIPFLVGNSGSFVSRYAPTFIEVCHPAMTLWQYDERTRSMKILQRMELSTRELAAQARFFNCG